MRKEQEEDPTADGGRVDAGLELLDGACDDIKEVVYGNGLYGNEFDILALLVTIYCRRAQVLGVDPQDALETYWPHDAPWTSSDDNDPAGMA
jgi:hypothetical protein